MRKEMKLSTQLVINRKRPRSRLAGKRKEAIQEGGTWGSHSQEKELYDGFRVLRSG